jgi:hypothetical protein
MTIRWRKSTFSGANGCVEVGWRKSTFSADTANCVEVGWTRSTACSSGSGVEVSHRDGRILVRDSKNRDAEPLAFTAEEWAVEMEAMRNGHLPNDMYKLVPPVRDIVWVWERADRKLSFTDAELGAFWDGVEAGEFAVEVLTRG